MIYFDNAATSKPYKEVLETYENLCQQVIGNPSSANGLGGKSKEMLEKARKQIAATLGVSLNDYEIVFTSGATESNNAAILGYARRHAKQGKHLITSQGEHDSVLNVFQELEKEGFSVTYLALDKEGRIPLEELKAALRPDTTLVSLMAINNEVGTIYPLNEYSALVHSCPHVAFMSDLTQGIGKTEINFNNLDLFTMSSHKVGGLKSSGLLGIRKGILLDPIIYGGGQEEGLRSGTVNVPLACSLATALRLYFASFKTRMAKAQALHDYLYQELSQMKDEVVITSPKVGGTPYILNFGLLHDKGSVVVEALSAKDIYVSTRSACSDRAKSGSHVLRAMGLADQIYDNSIRLSFEGGEDVSQGAEFISALKGILASLKKVN